MKDYDYRRIDALFHSRIRLAAAAMLYHDGQADFTALKEGTGATDGNLSTHLRKMEDAGYVEAEKIFIKRKPVTRYMLTKKGRAGFEAYVRGLENLIKHSP